MVQGHRLRPVRPMSPGWTGGAWERRESQIGVIQIRKTGTGVEQRRFALIAFTSGVTHRRDYRGGAAIEAEQNANGDLIAAAPDLAAAAELVLERLTDGRPAMTRDEMEQSADVLRAALAKAGACVERKEPS
jgi:hypothetical protein